jgi:hypothetical protein
MRPKIKFRVEGIEIDPARLRLRCRPGSIEILFADPLVGPIQMDGACTFEVTAQQPTTEGAETPNRWRRTSLRQFVSLLRLGFPALETTSQSMDESLSPSELGWS